jgi:hypothetical protein
MTLTSEDSFDSDSPVEVENPPKSDTESCPSSSEDGESDNRVNARDSSLAKLQGATGSRDTLPSCCVKGKQRTTMRRGSQTAHATVRRRRRTNCHDAVIVLKEEKVSSDLDHISSFAQLM